MRILHLESGRHRYGGARQVANLIAGLTRRGVESVLACPPEQPLARELVDVRVVPLTVAGDFDLSLARRLAKLIESLRPDVVHVHSRRGVDLHGGRASRAAGRPAILTRRVDETAFVPWARVKYRPYSRIVAISRAVETELRERVGLPAAIVRLVPSSVDGTRFRPDPDARSGLIERFGLPPDSFVIGQVAQFIPRKGHAFIVDCMQEIARRQPQTRLLLFGQGAGERAVRRRVRERGLDAHVVFAGFEPDIERVLPGLDLLVHPAAREGLGNAIMEAMSTGLAVVAANVGGIPDLIEPGVDGLLLPPRARDAWVRTIAELAADAGERARLGASARGKALRAFTIDAMAKAYHEIYREVGRDVFERTMRPRRT